GVGESADAQGFAASDRAGRRGRPAAKETEEEAEEGRGVVRLGASGRRRRAGDRAGGRRILRGPRRARLQGQSPGGCRRWGFIFHGTIQQREAEIRSPRLREEAGGVPEGPKSRRNLSNYR